MRHRAGISPKFNQGGLDFIRPFLAMASLKSSRLWASSFGLTKRFYSFTPKHLTSMTMLIKHLRPLFLLLLAALTLTLQAQHVKFKVGGGLATHYGHDHAVGSFFHGGVFTARRPAENRCYVKKFTYYVIFFTYYVIFFT